MADFRTIHSKIWEDDWFCSLSAEALKNTLIYVIINTVEGTYTVCILAFNAISAYKAPVMGNVPSTRTLYPVTGAFCVQGGYYGRNQSNRNSV